MALHSWIHLVAGFVPGAVAAPSLGLLARRWGLVSQSREDRFTSRPVPLAGGAALWLALALPLLILPGRAPWAWNLLALSSVALAIGILDDTRDLRPLTKGVLTLLLALAAPWVLGERNPADALLAAAVCWLLLHSFNIIDNMDGVALGTATISFAGVSLISGSADAWGATGAALGVLVWNLPRARVFLGDGGSFLVGMWSWGWWMGLTRASPAGGDPPLAALLLWALPLVDLVFVSVTRTARGTAPWVGGRDHLTHRAAVLTGSVWRALGLWLFVHLLIVAAAVLAFRP